MFCSGVPNTASYGRSVNIPLSLCFVQVYQTLRRTVEVSTFLSVFCSGVPNTASYGRSVVTVSATDADSQGPSGVTFSIAAGNVDGVFRVHPETGVVSNQLLLNAYTFHSFVLVVRASDAVTRPAAVTAKVKVSVGKICYVKRLFVVVIVGEL